MISRLMRNSMRLERRYFYSATSPPLSPLLQRQWAKHTMPRLMSVENKADHITIGLSNDRSIRFHHVWLRDTCPCPDCLEQSSFQRLLNRSDDRIMNAKVVQVDIDAWSLSNENKESNKEFLSIKWSDGHESTYLKEFLLTYAYDDGRHVSSKLLNSSSSPTTPWSPPPPPAIVWTKSSLSSHLPTIDYEYIESSTRSCEDAVYSRGLYEWLRALVVYGLCVLKNVPTEPNTVIRMAQKIGDIRRTMYGDELFYVRVDRQPTNVAYTAHAIPPHNDLLYLESPPGVQFLHCLTNEVSGGQNTFVDSFEVARRFELEQPTHAETLKKIRFSFHKYGNNHWLEQRRYLMTDTNCPQVPYTQRLLHGSVLYSSPFMAPLDAHFDDVLPAFRAYAELSKLIEQEAINVELKLAPGDLVSFNNRRVFHSRRAFDASEGNRLLEGTYVDFDQLMSQYRVQQRAFETNLCEKRFGLFM